MSQEFECRPQYSPRLPAVLAVRIWPISANENNSKRKQTCERYNIHFERRESLLTKTIVSLIEYAYRVPQNSENLVKDFT